MRKLMFMLTRSCKSLWRRVRNGASAVFYLGTRRWCPVCGKSSRRFLPHGRLPREEARCPQCGALERHRLLWLFLQKKTDLFDGRAKKMLHVAPETCFEPEFRSLLKEGYLTADLYDPRAMVKMDITDIHYPDGSFDIIFCNHVLEHITDDRQAMRELCRVLKQDGWAILLVPITSNETLEDPSVVDPGERLKLFGQEDHVRRYGPDYADRLRDAGFKVRRTNAAELMEPDDAVAMGLTSIHGEIFCCTKRAATWTPNRCEGGALRT